CVFFVRLWIPESPMFLMRKNRHEQARKVIDNLVRATGTKPVAYRLEPMDSIPKMSARAVFDQLRRVWAFSWRTTLAVWLLFLTVMFVYYVSLQWLPTILMEAGFEQTRAFLTTGGMAAVELLGALLATFLVETTGRRPLLAVAAVLGSILLVILAMVLHVPAAVLPLVLVYGLIIQVAIPVMYAYASELYPTQLRSSGFGWASAV